MVYKHISIGNENQVLIKTQEVYKCKKKKKYVHKWNFEIVETVK